MRGRWTGRTLARALGVLGILAGVLVAPAATGADVAAAHPLAHRDAPRMTDLEPAAGAVVSEGRVEISALAIGDRPVVEHELFVNGEAVAASAPAGDHVRIGATLTLEPGRYTVELFATDDARATGRRAWQFRVSPLEVTRLSGADRIGTAVAVSRALYPAEGGAAAAVLARADDFPDALAGAPLAVAEDGPLLLTAPDALHPDVAEELRRALPAGAPVYLLGGEEALAPAVAEAVAALGLQPERLSGRDRFATAVAIARRLPPADHAVLASGDDFADALAASSPAAVEGWPVLLTGRDALPEPVADFVGDASLQGVHVVGGDAAVGPGVRESLRSLGVAVSRTGGATRFETAAAVGARFLPDATVVSVAAATRFPDALAGAVHAARRGAPLLLVDAARVFNPQLVQLGAAQPDEAYVYGGTAVVGPVAVGDLRRAAIDAGGPLLERSVPTGEVRGLDEILFSFDRDLVAEDSSVYVTVDGHEVAGAVDRGDLARELVFRAVELPELAPGRSYEVRAWVSASDGVGRRHVEHRFVHRQGFPTLSRGDAGPSVEDLQRRLAAAGYWVGGIDGQFGTLTHQAVLAFQKVHGLPLDGAYDEATRALLESSPARPTPRSGPGTGLTYEIDLERQVLMRVVDGRVEWVLNTSTGHGRWYTFQGRTFRATTTTGLRRVARQVDGVREAERGVLWRPKYFDTTRGIAIHGSTSVPAYPASAGCVRLTYAAMDFLWSLDPGIGARVWVYPEGYY